MSCNKTPLKCLVNLFKINILNDLKLIIKFSVVSRNYGS